MSPSFTGKTPPQKRVGALPFSKSAIAWAEAILPGTKRIPAADEATVAEVDEVVRELEPSLVKAWRAAQATLDAAVIAMKGRPFHALSADEQDAFIRKCESDPVLRVPMNLIAMPYRFVHLDRTPVYEAMGGKLNVVTNLEQPRWLRQVHRADEWADSDDVECDVVVVGTGAGGGVVGKELAERGLAVVFVEEGEHYRRDSFDGKSLPAHQRFYRAALSFGNATMPIFIGRLVGGSTAINGGTCYRTPSWVLDKWCEELGTDELSTSAMKRHFDRVESILQVGYTDKKYIGPIADIIGRGCDALGWHHGPILRNAPGCDGSGFCDFGCRTGAKRGTDVSYVPPALERGSVLFTGLRIERVIVEGGRAAGVQGVSKNGRTIRVRARTVVLAGGAIPTPLLLLGQDLGNASGEVGRNLSVHPSSGFSGLFDEPIYGRKHVPQGWACEEFLRDGVLLSSAQPDTNIAGMMFPFNGRRLMDALEHIDHIGGLAILVHDEKQSGRVWRDVGGYPAITYNASAQDVAKMHQGMVRSGEILLAAGAKRLYPSALKFHVMEGERDFREFKKASFTAADIAWASYHPLGTCKMGRDPRTSVVDIDHQVHGVPGLFIADGSTVPTATGVNPQLTIMAMATRAAEKIAERAR